MKKIVIISVSDSWHQFKMPLEEYSHRIQNDLEIIQIKPVKTGEIQTIKKNETIQVLHVLKNYQNTFKILCDENGKSFGTTKNMATLLDTAMQQYKQVVFLIGGSYGYDTDILRSEIDSVYKMSDWTLPHGLATLMLVEQIYRVLNLLRGGKYHHE